VMLCACRCCRAIRRCGSTGAWGSSKPAPIKCTLRWSGILRNHQRGLEWSRKSRSAILPRIFTPASV
jgi:hypothetical protein